MTNVNIELSVRYEYSLKKEYFEENLNTLRESDKNKIGLYQYTHRGCLDEIFISDLYAIDKEKHLRSLYLIMR